MNLSDLDYDLPVERIAQEPLPRRDASRLLRLERDTGAIEHRAFGELPDLLVPGDLLVLNDTRVVPARLLGRKATGGRVEVLLLERAGGPDAGPEYRCLLHASKLPRPGTRIDFGRGLTGTVLGRDAESWALRLEDGAGSPERAAALLGQVPLPPYIRRGPNDPRLASDRERYQTVFARCDGSAAAPTAGLHFTSELLAKLEERGISLGFVTLHVGPGTFLPIRSERVEEHVMHSEAFDLPEATAHAVDEVRRRGGRVVAVGTTVVRTLETRALPDGRVASGRGRSALYIRPGFEFRAVDGMITNFHLPRTTLLLLVAAFAGRERVLAAYREAIARGYRFYSYGDAMLVESSR